MTKLNLNVYFQRIGYTDTAAPNLATLSAIQRLHTQTIPFENLNPYSGRPVDLSLEAIQSKLVGSARGGYCFEQNRLLQQVLTQIGFQVQGLAARVVVGQPADTHTPYTHMMLRVDLKGHTYIVDVGFGSMSLTAPLLLAPGLIQMTPHEPYRVTQADLFYQVESQVGGNWIPLYKFHMEPHQLEDYEMMNWYTSCHPKSKFTHTLIAARAFDGGRYTLRNQVFNTHYLDRESVKQELGSVAEMVQVLEEVFLVDLAGLGMVEAWMGRVFEGGVD